MAKSRPVPPPRLLICEGPEDRFFFERLIEEWRLHKFVIWDAGGNTRFAETIERFRIEQPGQFSSLKGILIVADNDETPPQSFRNVCDQIEEVFGSGTAPPAELQQTATRPPVTVLTIPWPGTKGHLEKMCVDSARDADRTIGSHVDTFLSLLAADRWANESRVGKAWLRSDLAARCQTDPFIALGTAFNDSRYRDLIPVQHRSFKRVADFLGAFAP